jgi:hypothetical protein
VIGLCNDSKNANEAIITRDKHIEELNAKFARLKLKPITQQKSTSKYHPNPEANRKMQQRVRACHETVSKRLKQWGCVYQNISHAIPDHAEVFRAVTVITQLCISLGEPLFQVPYSKNPRLAASRTFSVLTLTCIVLAAAYN